VMDERQQSAQPRNEARTDATPNEWQVAAASLPVLAALLTWRWRRRRDVA